MHKRVHLSALQANIMTLMHSSYFESTIGTSNNLELSTRPQQMVFVLNLASIVGRLQFA